MTDHIEKIDIGWNFDNSYTALPEIFYTKQNPTAVNSPKLIVLNSDLAKSLGLNIEGLTTDTGVFELSGNCIPDGATPLAQAYAGHQFGNFTMLGDGRAILLGEQITPNGQRFDIQLKGSGRTPYSRRGDGLAALGPMLREYIMSEAMYALGIDTTRSIAVVETGEQVIRETLQKGAVLTRVASSHIRVGTFQFAAEWGSVDDLRALVDYTIQRHFPYVVENENQYLGFLQEVIESQAELIAKWLLVGFIHGVMNTDNMSICGETIDYGPCAFMDNFDPATVFSSIDTYGRYAFGNQPQIAAWNLARFAETLLPLLDENQEKAIELAEEAINQFFFLFHEKWFAGMRAKLGLLTEEKEDESLVEQLLSLMEKHHADYTNTFRALTLDQSDDFEFLSKSDFIQWKEDWQNRLIRQDGGIEAARSLMRKSNPSIIPRNHRVEEALEAAVNEGDLSVMERFLEVLSKPFAYSKEQEEYAKPPEPSSCPYKTFCGT